MTSSPVRGEDIICNGPGDDMDNHMIGAGTPSGRPNYRTLAGGWRDEAAETAPPRNSMC